MTREQFIETPPQKYGNNRVNLLLSSSVSYTGSVPSGEAIPPYTVLGISLPDTAVNGVDLTSPLRNVESLRFNFGNKQIAVNITGKRRQQGYFYYLVDPIVTNEYPTDVGPGGEPLVEDSHFVFVPYVQSSFNNSDYNPLINNSEGSKPNVVTQVVDRFASQNNPTNLEAILARKAEPAELQNCSYTKVGSKNQKYNGTKLTNSRTVTEYNKSKFTSKVVSTGIKGNEPAMAFRSFEGSLHSLDVPDDPIRQLADREIEEIYFQSTLVLLGNDLVYPNFPITGDILYKAVGNNKNRIVNQKVYGIEDDIIYTLLENGEVNTKMADMRNLIAPEDQNLSDGV